MLCCALLRLLHVSAPTHAPSLSLCSSSGLCKASRKKWGFIASADGLALAYPVIAARPDGTAVVVYSYSGATEELPHSLGPAYPGDAGGSRLSPATALP